MALADLLLRGAGALGQRLAATQQPQAPTTPNPLQTAFTNALINPNMPIEAGFQTPSAKVNADLERQARIRNQLLAGRSAIIERARAQGRQVDVDPNTGQLIIGDVPASSPVRTIGGQRFAFDAQGRPVGMAADTGVAPPRVQGQTTPSVLTPEMADMNRQRIAAALGEALRRSAAPAAAAAPAMAAPAVVAQRPTAPLPDDTPAAASAAARRSGLLGRATGAMPEMAATPTPEQALAESEVFLQEQPARTARETAETKIKTYQQEVSETTRALTRARASGDAAGVRRLRAKLEQLLQGRPGSVGAETVQAMQRQREQQFEDLAVPFSLP